MVTTVNTLAQASAKIREYIMDARPLNLEEMRNIADVIDSVAVPLGRIARLTPDNSFGWQVRNDWYVVKVNLGRVFP